MSDRSKKISKLLENATSRAAYVRAKLNVNIPSQIRALRRRRGDMTQQALAESAGMKQSRISAMERPGETKFNLETLIRLAAAFKVGLSVRFVSFSEMLDWENNFTQDQFDVITLEKDAQFLTPARTTAQIPDSLAKKALGSDRSKTGFRAPRFQKQAQGGYSERLRKSSRLEGWKASMPCA